jgi:hypothetical protein
MNAAPEREERQWLGAAKGGTGERERVAVLQRAIDSTATVTVQKPASSAGHGTN